VIEGARCLDPFAGTGALGLEAASRGAASVVLIERSGPVARRLSETIRHLEATGVQVIQADTLGWLADPGRATELGPFDLVLLDPPFASGALGPACALLDRHPWLAPRALVYLEAAQGTGFPPLPEGWELIRDRRAGQVRYALAQVRPSNALGPEVKEGALP
jgi:16S rRNA (guanine966-N2)-methyltransferase